MYRRATLGAKRREELLSFRGPCRASIHRSSDEEVECSIQELCFGQYLEVHALPKSAPKPLTDELTSSSPTRRGLITTALNRIFAVIARTFFIVYDL